MILSAIIAVGLLIVGGLLGLFPAYTLPSSITGFGGSIGSSINTLNGIFPVYTMGVCLAALLGLQLFITLWDVVVYVYRLIPFKAS